MDFIKGNDKLEAKVGVLSGNTIELADIKRLADMPTMDAMIATAMASMNAPLSNFVRTLNEIPSGFVRVLGSIQRQNKGFPSESEFVSGGKIRWQISRRKM
jgi:large subunit ribosomal protein L10